MKIRITKKGLPKAQYLFSQPGVGLQPGAQQNFNWMTQGQTIPAMPGAVDPSMFAINPSQGTVAQQQSVMPIKRFDQNEWINKDMSRVDYAVNKGAKDFSEFMNTNPAAQGAMKAGNALNSIVDVALPIAQMIDNKKKNREIERAYRRSLVSQPPVNYTVNRGDYEINTGMVDPYNTGAKSKGQFTNLFYLPQAAEGLTLGPLSFSDTPVRRIVNTYEPVPTNITIPTSRAAADNTYYRKPVMAPASNNLSESSNLREWLGQRESGNNYKATNKVSSAAGKYQFLWNTHKNNISRITGVKSKQEFLNNPDAQEKYFEFWDNTVLTPKAMQIKQKLGVGDSIDEIKARIHFAGPAGAYKYYATGEETRDAFGTTTSSYVRMMGGENIDPMKIRITKQPMTDMAYGGQMGYGLDLGARRVYTDMPESQSDTVSRTLGPVPEQFATIEAEKDETILTDVDGDGMREHMTIGGKRHSQGGTPLAAQPGDFVFSDTKKMKIKNPALLAMFGKTMKSGGYTPADIAKQYNINKFKAILQDPNSDDISKNTAEMMIDNYEKKLGLLSFVQEGMKGFPQGIPAVSKAVMADKAEVKFGGYLDHYQVGSQVPTKVKKSEIPMYEQQGYKRVGTTNVWRKDDKIVESADPTKGQTTTRTVPGKKYVPNENAWWRSLTPAQKAAHNERVRKMIKEDPQYQEKVETITTPDTCPEGYTLNPATGKCEKVTPEVKQITYDEKPGIPGVPEFKGTDSNMPGGWTQQDMNNLMLALRNRGRIKKYSSVRPDINPALSDFRNMDWRGRAAELQGTYNSQLNTLGTYQSPTSLAANASFMAGQQAENLVNRAIDPIEQANVSIYNQVANQNAGIMNQALANAAQNRFLRSQDRAVLNQQYDNAMNDADKALTQAMNQGLTNAAGIYNTNITESPYYYIDPRTQMMKFNSPAAKAQWEAIRRNPGAGAADPTDQYLALRNKLKGQVPEDKLDDVVQDIMFGKSSSRASQTTYPYNPQMNRTTVQGYVPYNPLLPGK